MIDIIQIQDRDLLHIIYSHINNFYSNKLKLFINKNKFKTTEILSNYILFYDKSYEKILYNNLNNNLIKCDIIITNFKYLYDLNYINNYYQIYIENDEVKINSLKLGTYIIPYNLKNIDIKNYLIYKKIEKMK